MRNSARFVSILLISLCMLPAAEIRADVELHPLFTDHMVLQQSLPIKIWGWADRGEKITVELADQKVETTCEHGRWLVELEPVTAGGPHSLKVRGSNTIELEDVLIGEVWVCSGQSNMQWPMHLTDKADERIAQANHPQIRLFEVARRIASKPRLRVVTRGWEPCTPETVRNFSAVGYYFGQELQKQKDVPVGLILTAWGGTPAEAWTSRPTLEAAPALKPILDLWQERFDDFNKHVDAAINQLEQWRDQAAKLEAEGHPVPTAPKVGNLQNDPRMNPHRPAGLYNAMLRPLMPFSIRGAIWYQGESNAPRAYQYRTLFPAMIQDWRSGWGLGDFPFLFVQLAPFQAIVTEPQESDWAELREAQLMTLSKLPNTGMAVIIDVGDPQDIHPRKKKPVGQRLATAARGIAYGEEIVYSGPLYRSMEVQKDRVVLHFDHVGSGLVAKDGKLKGFTIAGKDRVFVNAEAKIEGDTVVVWHPDVTEPTAVRYGWANYPVVNLWNKDGLPASPFRTDDFPITTGPK